MPHFPAAVQHVVSITPGKGSELAGHSGAAGAGGMQPEAPTKPHVLVAGTAQQGVAIIAPGIAVKKLASAVAGLVQVAVPQGTLIAAADPLAPAVPTPAVAALPAVAKPVPPVSGDVFCAGSLPQAVPIHRPINDPNHHDALIFICSLPSLKVRPRSYLCTTSTTRSSAAAGLTALGRFLPTRCALLLSAALAEGSSLHTPSACAGRP
jgi:hypothetical protein